MGLKCISITAAVVAVASFFVYQRLFAPMPVPKVDLHKYWGRSSRANQVYSTDVKPFKIDISPEVITKLQNRLAEPLNLVEPLEGVGFRYGFNSHKLEDIVKYWRDDYLPRWHIQGLKIHFIYTKDTVAKSKNVIPLLLLHGWPGSVREFYEFIPKLSKPIGDISFVIVAPSLPGYGFSDGAAKPGLGPNEIAVILRNLMISLGYKRFLVQGGDWGSVIGASVATLFPENVIGYHSNWCLTSTTLSAFKSQLISLYPSYFMDEKFYDYVFPISAKFTFLLEESGYFHLQATKPDTIGIALSNNPVGLAAYFLEKFSTFSNFTHRDMDDGGLDNVFPRDALFDNLMYYYLPNSMTTSFRLYAEYATKRHSALQMGRVPTNVPTGCARFKFQSHQETDFQLASKFTNIIHSTWYEFGGHFIALEKPDVLAADFIQFIGKLNGTE